MGVFVTSPCPEVVEVLAATGFDFVIIDCEHGGSGIETVIDMIRGAEAYGMPTVVRAQLPFLMTWCSLQSVRRRGWRM